MLNSPSSSCPSLRGTMLDFTRHSEWASHEESHRMCAREFRPARVQTPCPGSYQASSFIVRITTFIILLMRLLRRLVLQTRLLAMTGLLLLLSIITSAQQSWMRPPIDSPLYLSGNLCALRGGHFHYGIDLPTNNTEGWPIRAVADGYVSRVNISPFGYGNALFITHYNSYTTVYAHLSKYEAHIYNYILAQHYKRQSFSLDVFPQKNLLKVKKGDIIAYSGNSGGSTGPHLHFEVRDASNLLVNPQLFLDIPDTAKPVVQNIYIINNEWIRIGLNESNLKEVENYNNRPCSVYHIPAGEYVLEAEIFDRQFFYENKLSPQEVKVYQNERLIYRSNFKSFGFHHDKYINRHTNNTFLWDSGKYLQKLYIDKNNFAPFYERSIGNGRMQIKEGEIQYLKILVSDAKGNESDLILKLVGVEPQFIDLDGGFFNITSDSSFEIKDSSSIAILKIDKASLDLPAWLQISYNKDGEILVSGRFGGALPFLKPASFSVPMPSLASNVPQSKLLLAEINKDNIAVPIQTKIENNKITGIIYHTGTYKIVSDITKPKIEFVSDNNNQIIYKISDELSGISSYRMTINGKWVMAKYDVKAGKLIYDKDSYLPKAAQYIISVSVCDNIGNCNYITNTILTF